MSLEDDRYHLLFDVRRSIRYHNRRRSFFDRWGIITNAISVIFGSATIYAIFQDNGLKSLAVFLAAIVTIFSTVDLVVGTNNKGRLHSDLARRFNELEREMTQAGCYDESTLRTFTTKRLKIESDEPPVLRVLDSICHNELMRAMGHEKGDLLEIGWFQRLVSQFIDFREHKIHSK